MVSTLASAPRVVEQGLRCCDCGEVEPTRFSTNVLKRTRDKRASKTPTLEYLARLGEAAGEDRRATRRLIEAVRQEDEDKETPLCPGSGNT